MPAKSKSVLRTFWCAFIGLVFGACSYAINQFGERVRYNTSEESFVRDDYILSRPRYSSSTDDAAAHFSLFGGITGLEIVVATVSIIIIVCAVQLVEYFFHMLHVITHDTPFYEMIQSIEKELMVVGFTAFMFKILVNTTSFLVLNWFHALEYAGKLLVLHASSVSFAP
jgi:hypothetical protein